MTRTIGVKGFALAAALALAACEKPAPEATAASIRIYAANELSGDLSIIDGATNAVIATTPLGKRPRGMRLSEDGDSLYVTLSGTPFAGPGVDASTLPPPDKGADGIGVVDLAQGRLTTILRGVSDPDQIEVGPSGKLYVASGDTDAVVVMDPATGAILASIPVAEPEGLKASPDCRFIYVASERENAIAVIDTASDRVTATIPVGMRPRNVAFSPDGRFAYAPAEEDASISMIDTATAKVIRRATVPGTGTRPMGIVLSPDGRRLYVTTGRGATVVALDATSLQSLGSVTVGQRPWGVTLSPDGRRLYAANGPSDDVSVVDTEKMEVLATVKVGTRPWGIAVAPAN